MRVMALQDEEVDNFGSTLVVTWYMDNAWVATKPFPLDVLECNILQFFSWVNDLVPDPLYLDFKVGPRPRGRRFGLKPFSGNEGFEELKGYIKEHDGKLQISLQVHTTEEPRGELEDARNEIARIRSLEYTTEGLRHELEDARNEVALIRPLIQKIKRLRGERQDALDKVARTRVHTTEKLRRNEIARIRPLIQTIKRLRGKRRNEISRTRTLVQTIKRLRGGRQDALDEGARTRNLVHTTKELQGELVARIHSLVQIIGRQRGEHRALRGKFQEVLRLVDV